MKPRSVCGARVLAMMEPSKRSDAHEGAVAVSKGQLECIAGGRPEAVESSPGEKRSDEQLGEAERHADDEAISQSRPPDENGDRCFSWLPRSVPVEFMQRDSITRYPAGGLEYVCR